MKATRYLNQPQFETDFFYSYIHDCFKDNTETSKEILTSGKGRKSLLSVSMMVLCKNKNNSYDALCIRRSENVDAKVGFLQFVLSGGFSALDAGLDILMIIEIY